MENLLTWAAENERHAASFYQLAARHFRQDTAIYDFLSALADDEEEHFQTLARLGADVSSGELSFAITPDALLETSIRGRLRDATDQIFMGNLDEYRLWRLLVDLEFAENNAIFLHVVQQLPPTDSDEPPAHWLIDRHLDRIESFLIHRKEAWHAATELQQLRPAWQKRILVMEDDPQLSHLFSLALSRLAWVTQATDSETAWQVLKRSTVDMVVLDTDMCPGDVSPLIEQILAKQPHLKGRIILCCSEDQAEDCVTLPLSAVLPKPLRLSQLVQTVEASWLGV